jgi:hypothetical protein
MAIETGVAMATRATNATISGTIMRSSPLASRPRCGP